MDLGRGVHGGHGGSLRNEAICRVLVLDCWGWKVISRRLFGLEAFEFLEGMAVISLGGIDAALETGKGIAVAVEGFAEDALVDRTMHAVFPELGLDEAKAAKEPLAIDQGIDEHALLRGGGMEAPGIFPLEVLQVAAVLEVDDLGLGVDAGAKGVHGGTGFAFGGTRSG